MDKQQIKQAVKDANKDQREIVRKADKEEIKKSFFAVIETLWKDPKVDVFYIQNYAWDWVEELLEKELKAQRTDILEKIKRITDAEKLDDTLKINLIKETLEQLLK